MPILKKAIISITFTTLSALNFLSWRKKYNNHIPEGMNALNEINRLCPLSR